MNASKSAEAKHKQDVWGKYYMYSLLKSRHSADSCSGPNEEWTAIQLWFQFGSPAWHANASSCSP